MKIKNFLLTVFFTILFYRVTTYILIYFIGNTSIWNRIYSDNLNHYQLGLIIIVFTLIFRKTAVIRKYMQTLMGIGIGMIIDEVTDVLKLFNIIPFPYHYRDSISDLILIILTYFFFLASVILGNKLKR